VRTRGEHAEQLVAERVRAVVDKDVAVLPNVHWLLRDHGAMGKGEADLVIGDPERGILVLEVKAGEIRRDDHGTWWAGSNRLDRSPFRQASDNRYALIRKLYELPDWPADLRPIQGEGVALPHVDLDTMRGRLGLLGLDAEHELIADQSAMLDDDGGRRELRAFLDRAFEVWSAKSGEQPPGRAAIDLLVATMTSPLELRSMLRNEIVGGEADVVRLTATQYSLLDTLRGVGRASIVGGAGTGKTMLAAEKARRLAREGFTTLLVCFNAPLARSLSDATTEVASTTGRLDVATFHQLCQDLGREAGVLGERQFPVPQQWWDETLPRALMEAADRLGPRYHAIVVDEGQDFAPDWLLALEALSFGGGEDVLYVFHDPAQAIYREDVVGQLGLQEYPLLQNCRNAQSIHRVVERFAEGGLQSLALRDDGRPPELIEADGEASTLEALRTVLHRLRVEEDVLPWHIAVLTGARLEESAVWRQRRFGNEVLENPSVDDEGHHLGAAAHETPELPSDAILCDTIRRFKGLERPVVVLVELDGVAPEKLDRLLYVGASRARQHLVVIGSPAVLGRLR
jgi:hypothetical protein